MGRETTYRTQVGALPVRGKIGQYEVLLVTSHETRSWIIPKGWPVKNKADHEAAAQEALEVAGVIGRIHKHPMGSYVYEKRSDTTTEPLEVMVYLLEVHEETKDWRERSERLRKWMSAAKAAKLVDETELAEIILRLNTMPDSRPLSSGKREEPMIR